MHALITYTPRWARPEGRSDKAPPIDPDELARFAGHAVRRYQPLGITSWEVWNEPNSSNFWDSPTGPDPALYAELFRVTARAIKDVDDGATVITGGLAPAVDRPMLELSPVRFLDEMYDSLEPGLVDGIGVHPYSYPALPLGGQRWNQFSSLPDLQKLVEEREGEPVQLWITEFGAPTGEADNAVDAERQAKIVSDALHCASSVPWIGPVFIYNLHDRPGGQPEDVEDNFGLVTAEGAWKPAADIVQAFQQEADGAPVPDPCHDW